MKVLEMKKIIGGRRYDTETATFLGNDCAECSITDFGYWREELYQKRTGEFFLAGSGGPMTKYAVRVEQNGWRGGDRIMPLSFEEAKEWAENHLTVDEYEAIFGEVSEGDSRATITLSLSAKTIEILKRMCAETGKNRGEIIDMLIQERPEMIKAERIRMTAIKFCVIDTLEHDEFVTVCESMDEALREAYDQYSVLTDHDRKRRTSFCVGTITCTWDPDKETWKAWADGEGDIYTVIKEYPVG